MDSQGRQVGAVQADDWDASLQHVADCGGGQEELYTSIEDESPANYLHHLIRRTQSFPFTLFFVDSGAI